MRTGWCAQGKKGLSEGGTGEKVTQAILDQLRSSWRKMYGSDSEETTVILNDGVDFKDAGQTAVETQLNENKETNGHEIYKIFSIVPTVLRAVPVQEDLKNTVRFGLTGGQGPCSWQSTGSACWRTRRGLWHLRWIWTLWTAPICCPATRPMRLP